MMLDFKTVMVATASPRSLGRGAHASLSALYSQFGDVQTVDEVLESLDRGEKARAAA